MKFITLFASQYNDKNMNWSSICDCKATDFVFVPKAYSTSSDYMEQATAINTLVSKRTGTTNIWMGTPGINSKNYSQSISATTLHTYLKNVYNNLNSAAQKKVVGVYYNQEAIYASVSPSNPKSNAEVKRMADLRTNVKSGTFGGTGYLWIPYYGYGNNAATVIQRVGYVADVTTIFDYCIVQPHYMFDSSVSANLKGVKYSIDANKITYRDGVAVVAKKGSSTKIGFEMEIDIGVSGYANRFKEYVDIFKSSKSYPQGFYWAKLGDTTTFSDINDFFK